MLSKEEVTHIAQLARLKLTEKEKEEFTEELGEVLEYIKQISEVDTEGVEPTYYPLPSSNVFREDEVTKENRREEMLAEAPAEEDGQFKVPGIEQND